MQIKLTETIAVPESSVTESFVRASGPGGQNVNKVNSAVELRFDMNKAELAEEVRARLASLAGHRLTTDGVIVIHAHEHRTQLLNREAARARLADLLRRASRAPRPRRKTKPTKIAREKRLKSKHVRAVVKRRRTAPLDDELDV